MAEEKVGRVSNYFSRVSVAAIELEAALHNLGRRRRLGGLANLRVALMSRVRRLPVLLLRFRRLSWLRILIGAGDGQLPPACGATERSSNRPFGHKNAAAAGTGYLARHRAVL